ncbi:M20/M25/M40 family metallo-hydrolase [Planktosalinus lacus]|uniref:Carboxypeptidase Q n=1 Tax=Planktosalinus lacus TaxID=1526573 RepID=A0A8J2VB11_9FLAO|nr:M20/M25/M40 family metallo-hydrolase [Planktosalinus lacus]GGD94037.1 aminopeptidase [Planktosalinus lacus]
MKKTTLLLSFLIVGSTLFAQEKETVINSIIEEIKQNSQVEQLAFELTDEIGPRLVGTPQMEKAHQWAVSKFSSWGIPAENQEYGTWRGWERGITHIDLISPRVKTLAGMQLAWSAPTPKKGITAEVITLPTTIADSSSFASWLSKVKGKFVLVSMPQKTGRPDYNWEEFATEASFEKMKEERSAQIDTWNSNIRNSGYSSRTLDAALEKAGAAGIIQSQWSRGFGANKIFGSRTKTIPTIDILLEDYGLLYRLAENGKKPQIRLLAESKELGEVPTLNTIATIKGTEKPEEYIVLSAHFDSWDGGSGATDNATGTVTMMEIARILKKLYPNPKRSIIVGLWGGEEQGLNGSRAFVEDNPAIVDNIQVVFNQDNGTGRVVSINGQGFLHSYDFLGRWLHEVPEEYKSEIETTFPGTPSGGGSDHSSFVAAGAPAFMMSSLNWSYWNYTWHTNLDTYDKIVFDDVKNNVALIAIMTYLASEDPQKTSREQAVLPISRWSGNQMEWPTPRDANRKGGLD